MTPMFLRHFIVMLLLVEHVNKGIIHELVYLLNARQRAATEKKVDKKYLIFLN